MIAVIGDVHGCYHTLKQLVDKVKKKYTDIGLYCVGDLVDRGNFSFEVVDFVLTEKINFTLGNHDLMFYSFFRDPESSMAKAWIHNGAESTIKSYENKMDLLESHLDSIIKAPLFINREDCFISHAGISITFKSRLGEYPLTNSKLLNKVLSSDLYEHESILWCRNKLLNIGKLQVVGHTHRKETLFDEAANAIYIDTTAFGNNKLTAVIIENNKIIETIDQKTYTDDANKRWNYYL